MASSTPGGMGTGGAPSSNDKLLAALGYPIPIVPLYVLFTEKKNDPFLKFHAVQSLLVNVAGYILVTILSVVTFGIGGLCAPLFWLGTLYPAYKAYQGEYVEIPVLTQFMKGQGWA